MGVTPGGVMLVCRFLKMVVVIILGYFRAGGRVDFCSTCVHHQHKPPANNALVLHMRWLLSLAAIHHQYLPNTYVRPLL